MEADMLCLSKYILKERQALITQGLGTESREWEALYLYVVESGNSQAKLLCDFRFQLAELGVTVGPSATLGAQWAGNGVKSRWTFRTEKVEDENQRGPCVPAAVRVQPSACDS